MKIKYAPIANFKTNPNNPRVIREAQFNTLVESIKQMPKMLELRPPVVNNEVEMMILGGNQRYEAACVAGLSEIPYISAEELTEDQQKEFILKDNTNAGEWDFEMLQAQYSEQELFAAGLPDIKPIVYHETEHQEPAEDTTTGSLVDSPVFNKRYSMLLDFSKEEYEVAKVLVRNAAMAGKKVGDIFLKAILKHPDPTANV